jgi:hypothetical protein
MGVALHRKWCYTHWVRYRILVTHLPAGVIHEHYYPQRWDEDGERWHNILPHRKGTLDIGEAYGVCGGNRQIDKFNVDLTQMKYKPEVTKALIIGNGKSAEKVVGNHPNWFDAFWDMVVVFNANHTANVYKAELCSKARWAWMCLEIDNYDFPYFYQVSGRFRRVLNLLRILPVLEIYNRCADTCYVVRGSNPDFQPREYGLGLQMSEPECYGTVLLNAMHWLSICGAEHIDMVGCELGKDDTLHYWDKSKIDDTQRELFDNGAKYIASLMPKFSKAGVNINLMCKSKLEDYL